MSIMDEVTKSPSVTLTLTSVLIDADDYNYTSNSSRASESYQTSIPMNDSRLINATLPMPQYYSLSYQAVGCVLVTLIFVIGLLGNIMVVFVVARTRSMRTPTNCYLVSLAVADILLLVTAPLPTIVEYFLIVNQSMMAYLGVAGCSMMVFSQYLGINVSSLSITAFTIERYIAICHPMKAQTICTVHRAKRIIIGLWLFGVLYCAPWLMLTTTRTWEYADGSRTTACEFKLPRSHYLTYFLADIVIFYVMPLVVTCVLYGLIAAILYRRNDPQDGHCNAPSPCETTSLEACGNGVRRKSRVQRGTGVGRAGREDGKRWNDGASSSPQIARSIVSTRAPALTLTAIPRSSAHSSRVQVTKMLAVVVSVFAVLWLPYRAYVLYNSFATSRYESLWFLLFCRLMVYINSAINPILYNLMSIKFRRAFARLLACGGGKRSGLPAMSDRCSGWQNYAPVTHATSVAHDVTVQIRELEE